jgi:hypothetical protein
MEGVHRVLEAQQKLEHEFVAGAVRSETQPKGWPAALVMFHISMWRERLRDALTEFRQMLSWQAALGLPSRTLLHVRTRCSPS